MSTLTEKKRLDVLLFEQGHGISRERCQSIIMAGDVLVNGKLITKAGCLVSADAKIEIKRSSPSYVSRGGFKLEKGIQEFQIDLNGKICMDVGASSGGFTDCMLQHGAKRYMRLMSVMVRWIGSFETMTALLF
jgi:23S rRNA (cytidine1920-2'-O)/16S rRNA (cytidine1409-2'-O)-methyltransferase